MNSEKSIQQELEKLAEAELGRSCFDVEALSHLKTRLEHQYPGQNNTALKSASLIRAKQAMAHRA